MQSDAPLAALVLRRWCGALWVNPDILKMSYQIIFLIWLISAPIILWFGWRKTKDSQPEYYRILIRSLLISTALGFSVFGTHSAAIFVPWWMFLTTKYFYLGILSLLIWWVIVSLILFTLRAVRRCFKSEWDQFWIFQWEQHWSKGQKELSQCQLITNACSRTKLLRCACNLAADAKRYVYSLRFL